MHMEENCSCGQHDQHQGEQYEKRHEGHSGDCECGGHQHHGKDREWHHRGGCGCGCHQQHGDLRFNRHFISREEMVSNLEEYLKQLKAEAKGVEERIAEMKKRGESQPI